MSGVQKYIAEWKKKNSPTPPPVPPVPVPPPTPPLPPAPPPSTTAWRGCMFVPATKGMPNNKGVSSQLSYRGCHGQPNENAVRLDMFQCVKNWGGNTLVYIRGECSRPNEVLDMCLNGRKSPADGHYLPIKAPSAGEVDWAMWGKQTYGIDKHVCFIWNDGPQVPFTEAIVREAVEAYDGCRLGMENVMFGTCLETDSIIPNASTVAKMLGWIEKYAPQSPMVVGSQSENFLMSVGAKNSKTFLWLEQASHPINAPLTRATFPAYLASLNRIAVKCGKTRTVPGEWWAALPVDVKWITEQLLAAGFTVMGSGKYK